MSLQIALRILKIWKLVGFVNIHLTCGGYQLDLMHPFVRFAYLVEKHKQESVSFLTPCYKLQTSNCYHLLHITPTVRQVLDLD
jgi:hypothetical protein